MLLSVALINVYTLFHLFLTSSCYCESGCQWSTFVYLAVLSGNTNEVNTCPAFPFLWGNSAVFLQQCPGAYFSRCPKLNGTFFSLAAQASLQGKNTGFREDEIIQWPEFALPAYEAERNTSQYRGFKVILGFCLLQSPSLGSLCYQPISASLVFSPPHLLRTSVS